ncbi:MAG TPA: hypothetical protein DHV62_01790 [Elusimicrobia bacterium]|jgi:transcriptional regulator with XRE-family HTH domain|nr:hypothetical protein [Elusimicrobiota bacterium]
MKIGEDMEKSIGQILKEARGKRKITLEDVHKKTRISIKYILALEEDHPNNFPGEAYFLGFLRNYAKFLGLNSEELVEKYLKSLTNFQLETVQLAKESKSSITYSKYRVSVLLFLFVLVLIYFLFSTRLFFEKEKKISSPPKSINTSQERKLVLEAKASADTWLRVIADANLLYERILSSGTEKRWEAKEKFILRVGYVPGLEMKLNGKPVDLITGSSGYINNLVLP